MNYQVYASGPRKGQCKTVRDRLIRYLVEGRKFVVLESSERTVKLSYEDGKFLYLGKNGSCRSGKNKTTSQDIAEVVRKHMVAWESEKGLIA